MSVIIIFDLEVRTIKPCSVMYKFQQLIHQCQLLNHSVNEFDESLTFSSRSIPSGTDQFRS